jgi:phosphate transport system substrate-binding protein
MRRAKQTIVIISLALAGCSNPVSAPTATPQTVSVRMLATTAAYPLLQDFVQGFRRPGMLLAVDITEASWSAIYARFKTGDSPYALTTYLPADTGLWAAPIGQDAIAIIVHPDNAVEALTIDALDQLYRGRITTWADLGGSALPVAVVTREPEADTALAFQALVLGDERPALAARLALSNQRVIEAVATEPGAIGYVSLIHASTFLTDERVRIVAVAPSATEAPVFPDWESIDRGAYPLRTPILIVGLKAPDESSLVRDWFAWMQSESGKTLIESRLSSIQPAAGSP